MRRAKAVQMVGDIEVRSKLEKRVLDDLVERKQGFGYETTSFPWSEKIARAKCGDCGGVAYADRSYTPDVFLPNGIIIEIKGRFTSHDRKIAAAMKEQHPELDIRTLFQTDNWLNKNKKNKYSDWCEKKGILCAFKLVPEEWLK